MAKFKKRHNDKQPFPVKESGGKSHFDSSDVKKIKENEDEMLDFAKGKSNDIDKLTEENAKEFDVTVAVIKKLQEREEDDTVLIEKIDDGFNTVSEKGKYITLTNGATYNLFKDYDEMESEAEARIRNDLEEEPELFNKDFIDSHSEISKTDARLFGVDAGDMAIDDRDLDELKEMADQYGIEYDDIDDDEPDWDSIELGEKYDKAQAEWEKKQSDLETKLQDEISSYVADDVEERINNNGLRSYLCDDEGFCSDDEFMEQYGKWLHINIDDAVEDAISVDGVGHFISGYDGDYYETSDGQYLVKHND